MADDDGAEQLAVSSHLSYEIPPFASFDVKIGYPVPLYYGASERFKVKKIGISYESGRNTELSADEVRACTNDKMTFCIYKDENISISWKYYAPASYSLLFESAKSFDYSYWRFDVEQYEADGRALDSYEGRFFFDD